MQYGTLIYLKDKDFIAKYIIHKIDERKHLVQRALSYDYSGKGYYELNKKEIDAAIKENDIEDFLVKEIDREKKELDNLYLARKELINKEYYKDKLEDLNKQLENLKAKEETPERLNSIKQLEKAIRRKKSASQRDYKKEDGNLYIEIRNKDNRISKLESELKFIRKEIAKKKTYLFPY